MSIPGANLLRMARRLIKFQQVQYLKANGRVQNAARQWVPSFDPPVTLMASVQAVARNKYAAMGLDFNSEYVNIFAEKDMVDLARDSSGDRFQFGGNTYQMSQNENWYLQDGWATCLAIKINLP